MSDCLDSDTNATAHPKPLRHQGCWNDNGGAVVTRCDCKRDVRFSEPDCVRKQGAVKDANTRADSTHCVGLMRHQPAGWSDTVVEWTDSRVAKHGFHVRRADSFPKLQFPAKRFSDHSQLFSQNCRPIFGGSFVLASISRVRPRQPRPTPRRRLLHSFELVLSVEPERRYPIPCGEPAAAEPHWH